MSSESAPDDIVLSIRGVSKCYELYRRPVDRLKQTLWMGHRRFYNEFWALRDLSLDIHRGESIGIIGRNGAGKSTLLQIITGVLAPTSGEVRIRGRVAALLELGSGFNPEFTGRENVYMNASILGLSRAETEAKFGEIAAFADIGDFIEQPVKTYSSGMMIRLAFSVQAALAPDILVVDEALSVGDVYFQHKCMARIKELLRGGTSLLFVSHSTDVVKRFCSRGLWLEAGHARYCGAAGVAAEKYLAFMRMREAQDGITGDEEEVPSGAPGGDSTEEGHLSLPDSLGRMLSYVADEIDLSEERLFLRGDWRWCKVAESPMEMAARSCGQAGALVGFHCRGNGIELSLLRGPECGEIHVDVDGTPHTFDLFHPSERRVEKVRISLAAGEHTVLIASPEVTPRRQEVWLFGGRVVTDSGPSLAFRRDPAFGQDAGEVGRYGSGKGKLTCVELLDYFSGEPVDEMRYGQRLRLRLHAERLTPAGPRLEFSYIVRDKARVDLFGTTTFDEEIRLDPTARFFVVEFAFDNRLGPGTYSILAAFVECSEDLSQRVPMDQVDIAGVFKVTFNPLRPVWYAFHQPVSVTGIANDEGGGGADKS